MKLNDENVPNRDIYPTTRTEAEVSAERKGYVNGSISENIRKENEREEVDQTFRDNDNAGRGLLVGIIIAAVAGLVLSSVYFLNRRETTPLLIPVPGATQPSPTRIIDREKTIIERNNSSTDNDSTTKSSPTPNVNITVPNPRVQSAPAPSQAVPSQAVPSQATPSQAAPGNNINIVTPNNNREPILTSPNPAPQAPTTAPNFPGSPNPNPILSQPNLQNNPATPNSPSSVNPATPTQAPSSTTSPEAGTSGTAGTSR